MKKHMTVKDLAEIAGVNHSTVSRALNDSPRVTEATRERIKALAREYNFQFNSNARSLSRRKTSVIGIVFPAGMEDFNSSLYINRLFMDLRKKLESRRLDGILVEARHPDTGESNIERLIRQNKVDGFLVLHGEIPSEDYKLIRKWEMPVVQVHLRPGGFISEILDAFYTDNRLGGKIAARHLREKGCRRFFNVTIPDCGKDRAGAGSGRDEPEFLNEFPARSAGFHKALEFLGVPEAAVEDVFIDGTFLSARKMILERAGESPHGKLMPGDGLFFHSDLMAFGALTGCLEAGIRVPADVKIIGFDDSPIGTLTEPGITTIHQPREEIAERATARIVWLLEKKGDDEKCVQELLAPVLLKRETT